jgi:hypothetical protein
MGFGGREGSGEGYEGIEGKLRVKGLTGEFRDWMKVLWRLQEVAWTTKLPGNPTKPPSHLPPSSHLHDSLAIPPTDEEENKACKIRN